MTDGREGRPGGRAESRRFGVWLAREASAWGRAVRGAALALVIAVLALVVLRVAGLRGLLVAAVVGWCVLWLARLGAPRR